MGALVHLHNRFDPLQREVYRLEKPVTVRRLVQKHRGLRKHTRVYAPGGVYGRRKVREFARPTVCLLNGKPLTRAQWKRSTVGPADVVTFYAPPAGGGGGLLRIGLAIAAIAAVSVLTAGIGTALFGAAGSAGLIGSGGALFGSTIAATAVSSVLASAIVGAVSYGLMSLFAPPSPATQGTGYAGSTPASSPVYNLTAQGNYARLQSPIPESFGRNRLFPDFVTTPYARYTDVDPAEVPGSIESTTDQYLHHIVGLGMGEYEIDEDSLKLGDTPITSYPDIEWAVIEPGELPDLDIADERWITATDLADIEMPDADEGSDYVGPYAANPAGTTINRIEVDFGAPRGLWAFNPVSGGLDAREVELEIEARLIDDGGTAIGSWETFDPVEFNRRSQDLQRVTHAIDLPSAGRWEVRTRRMDAKDTSLQAGHQIDWIGLRGRVLGRRTFPGMTCIQLRMKAGEALNSAQSRQFNLVATRKLETWTGSAMGTVKAATRSPCDAFAYIARTSNGGRLADSLIALEELYEHKADFESDGWTFDFVFDNGVTVSEALARVARAVIAERVTQGGKLHLVRDVAAVAPVAMFSPRNILPGSDSQQYVMRDSTSPDYIIGEYIDQTTWKPREVIAAFDDSPRERPTRITLHGVGTYDQARAVVWHAAREDRYRRKVYGFTAPMEGLAVTFGDGISYSMDIPNYGQTLEAIDYDATDPNAPIFTFVDEPDFSDATATYYAAVRDSKARLTGPWVATAVDGEPNKLQLTVPTPADLPEILTGGDKERTWLQLGPGDAYAKPLKVKQVTPQSEDTATIVAFDDDPRMYAALPDEPEVPIGADLDPLTVPITNGDGPTVNLRALANEAGYSGLAVQEVGFTVAADVDVAAVRGSWPAGAVPTIELVGTLSGVTGAAGAGGAGGAAFVPGPSGIGRAGSAGGTGGTALDSSSGALVVTGTGTIRGGKGGGGGGGGGGSTVITDSEGNPATVLAGGAGGAGNGGSGAAGESLSGYTAGAGGAGGASGAYGGPGAPGAGGGTGALAGPGLLYPGASTTGSAPTITAHTTATSTSSGATLTVPNITANVGDWLILACAADNTGTSGASSTSATITDGAGNTWPRLSEINYTPGTAVRDGTTLSIWGCEVTNALSSDSVDINFAPDTTAKAAVMWRVVPAAGETIALVAVGGGASDTGAAWDAPSVSVSQGATIFGFVSVEGTGPGFADSDTTNGNWSTDHTAAASTGTVGTSQAIGSQWKTVSATGSQSYGRTFTNARDWAANYIILESRIIGAGGAGGAGGKAIAGVSNVDLSGFGGLIVGTTS